jgi:hypothetical protein
MFGRLVVVLLTLALAGCSTISGDPLQDVPKGPLGRVVIQGLQDATFNLDSAVTVGALSADDPAPKCFHSILVQLGADPASPAAPGASFTPKVSDLISFGSVLYIRAQQLKKSQGGGISVPSDCKVLMTNFLLDAAGAGVKGLPGGGLLPTLR